MMENLRDWIALTQLYADYARAVDSGDWNLWPEFFTDQCIYRLQPRENFERGFPLATLSFESKGAERVRRLPEAPWVSLRALQVRNSRFGSKHRIVSLAPQS